MRVERGRGNGRERERAMRIELKERAVEKTWMRDRTRESVEVVRTGCFWSVL